MSDKSKQTTLITPQTPSSNISISPTNGIVENGIAPATNTPVPDKATNNTPATASSNTNNDAKIPPMTSKDTNKDTASPTLPDNNKATNDVPSASPATPHSNTPTQSNQNLPANQPLAIPQNSNGDTRFLNGKWTARGGIQDKYNGKPLSLDYEFQDGKGSVTVKRGDGIKCTGAISPNIKDKALSLNSQGTATCSDGSIYELPNVQCQTDSSGKADCTGVYGKGSAFPMSMKSKGNTE